MQFLKVWGKNKRFLKILNFFSLGGPLGAFWKFLPRFYLEYIGNVGHVQWKQLKVAGESHTQKIRKIVHIRANLQSFLWGRGQKIFFGPPNFSKFLPIFQLQIALAQKPYLHFHFRFFSQNPKIHLSYLAKKLWKKPIFGFLFFLTNIPVCIQTYGREAKYKGSNHGIKGSLEPYGALLSRWKWVVHNN